MRRVPGRLIMLAMIVALAGGTTGVVAQENSSTVTIVVEVQRDPGTLTVSGGYTPDGNPIYQYGGIASGVLTIRVLDSRAADIPWYVQGSISQFSTSITPTTSFAGDLTMRLVSVTPANLTGAETPALSSIGLPPPAAQLLSSPTSQEGVATWETRTAVPAGAPAGTYSGTLTLNLYSGDPP